MCWLSNLFKPKVLPYPEEKPDYRQTIDNVNVDTIITGWMVAYFVPSEYRAWWQDAIIVTLTNDISYPAQTWENPTGKRHLDVRPEYLNHGVIAHEQAHNSYDLLGELEKQSFREAYTPLKTTDALIKLLYSKNPYGLTNDIEGHAEVYRYLGHKMPKVLKQYYPRLF